MRGGCTPAEFADASRDVLALLRAMIGGRQDDVDAILDGVADGEHGGRALRCVTETLLGMTAASYTRVTAFAHVRPELLELIPDAGELMARPGVRAAVDATLAEAQAHITGQG